MTQNNGENRALARLNTTTGEVEQFQPEEEFSPTEIIPYSALSGLLESYRDANFPGSRMPVHLAALESMQISDDQRLALEEAYNSQESITMKAFVARYANLDVRIHGITIYEHAPYLRKADGVPQPGFYQPRLLIETPKGELIVVRTGSQYLAEHIFFIIRRHGWWLFEEPLTYRFNAGESGALFMQHVYAEGEDLKSRLRGPKKVKVK